MYTIHQSIQCPASIACRFFQNVCFYSAAYHRGVCNASPNCMPCIFGEGLKHLSPNVVEVCKVMIYLTIWAHTWRFQSFQMLSHRKLLGHSSGLFFSSFPKLAKDASWELLSLQKVQKFPFSVSFYNLVYHHLLM